jgi:hypothetical protein
MAGKYRNENKYHTNGREIQERKKVTPLWEGKTGTKRRNAFNGGKTQELK